MARTQKEKVIIAEDEEENETRDESASTNDEGLPENRTRHGSITPPDEEKTHKELLRTTTDSEGYVASVSSAAEIHEGERGRTVSPSEMQVNLLEKTRIWKIRQLKEKQYNFLKPYLRRMVVRPRKLNWYRKFGEKSSRKPKMIEDLPCECNLEEEYKAFENTEEGCKKEEEKPTEQESSPKKSDNLIKYPFQHLAQHNNSCNVRRISLYFSFIAEYFIDGEVDPDMFLYIPFPIGKYEKESEVSNYNTLQKNRKSLLTKLVDGLKEKIEAAKEDMTSNDVYWTCTRNLTRISRNSVLTDLLIHLMKPHDKYFSRGKNSDADNDDDADDSNEKPLQGEDSEIYYEEGIDCAIHGTDYILYDEYLECQNKSEENKPSTSKDKNELEMELRTDTVHSTDELETKRKHVDSKPETEESETNSKKDDSEKESEKPERKRKKVDSHEETEESEIKREKVDLEQQIEEPECKRKNAD